MSWRQLSLMRTLRDDISRFAVSFTISRGSISLSRSLMLRLRFRLAIQVDVVRATMDVDGVLIGRQVPNMRSTCYVKSIAALREQRRITA